MKKIIPVLLLATAAAVVYAVKKYNEADTFDDDQDSDDIDAIAAKVNHPRKIEITEPTDETVPTEASKESPATSETTPETAVTTDASQEESTKLLDLQVDLVMANYPDSRMFLVQHHIAYDDSEKLMALIEGLKADGYTVSDNDEGITIEKIVLLSAGNEVKQDIMDIAAKVRADGGVYKGFNVKPQ